MLTYPPASLLLPPAPAAHEQHTRVIPSKTTTIKLNLHQFISSTPTVPPPPITTTSSPYKPYPHALLRPHLQTRCNLTPPTAEPRSIHHGGLTRCKSLTQILSLLHRAHHRVTQIFHHNLASITRRALISAVGSARAIHHNLAPATNQTKFQSMQQQFKLELPQRARPLY
ncbi:hypothetical protein KEM48_007125 [Puccinia striiformis f. sp. tritici PST-130]|nr:hypothetical protein KEM48_007125 [Puccinia striiformis f. sp. tritici PST-130]